LTLQIQEGVFQKGDNPTVDMAKWEKGTQVFEKDGRVYYLVIDKIEEPRFKTFEESRGQAISDYQTYLEQEWIKELKQKYPVTVNEEELKKLIREKN